MAKKEIIYPDGSNVLDLDNLPVVDPDLLYPTTNYYNPGVDRLGKYDTFWKPGVNQEAHRGYNQNWAQKWGNGLLRSTASVGTKTLAGLGHVLGGMKALGTQDSTYVYDNAISNFFANAEESLKEALPVHKQRQYLNGNLGKKMWTADFWADNFLDGVAFAASAFVGAKGVGGAGKVLNKLGMYKALTKLAKTDEALAAIQRTGHIGATAAYNTVSEAGVEAREIYKNLIADGVTEDKAKEAAMETFGLNMAVLTIPNALQAKWITGTTTKNFGRLKELAKQGGDSGISFGKKDFFKAMGEGIASEGLWEENVQTAIEKYETDYAKGILDENTLAGVGKNLYTNLKGFMKFLSPFHTTKAHSQEDEGATSILLGALIGAPMSINSEYRQIQADAKEFDRLNKWAEAVKPHAKNTALELQENLGAPFKQFSVAYEETNPETGET